jgi:hypothetical protein
VRATFAASAGAAGAGLRVLRGQSPKAILLLLLVLLAGGCSTRPTPCGGGAGGGFGTGTGGGTASGGVKLGLTGAQLSVTLTGGAAPCGLEQSNAGVTAQTRVRRPDGTELSHPPAQLMLAREFPEATVTFTPDVPGVYEVIARFEPNRGVDQVIVHAAHDLSKRTGRALFVTDSAGCNGLEELASGAMLCASNGGLRLYREGVEKALLPNDGAFSVRGDVVWTLREGVLRRYETSGDQFSAPLTVADSRLGQGRLRPISADSVLVVLRTLSLLVRKNGAALEVAAEAVSGLSAVSDAAWAVNDTHWLAATPQKACRGALGATAAPECVEQALGEPAVGSDADGIWFFEEPASIRVLPVRGAGAPTHRMTDFPSSLEFRSSPLGSLTGEFSPRLWVERDGPNTVYYLPRSTPEGIVLEDWGSRFQFLGATSKKVYGRRSTIESWQVFDRP